MNFKILSAVFALTLSAQSAFALESYSAIDQSLIEDVETELSPKSAWIQAVFQGHNPAHEQYMMGLGALMRLGNRHMLGTRALKGPGAIAAAALYQFDLSSGSIARTYIEPSISYYQVSTPTEARHLPSFGLGVGADVRLTDSLAAGISLGLEAYRADSQVAAAFKSDSVYMSPKGLISISAGF